MLDSSGGGGGCRTCLVSQWSSPGRVVELVVEGKYSGGHPGGFWPGSWFAADVLGLILGLCCWARAGSALLGSVFFRVINLGFLDLS
ncbi:hypothetical protein RchiOBHm_Chr7g0179301 [Rosa chinensis]|uniref:Uncharacterized protein n=1 Tax=Rosa chinensis TaxID=74649 RepID=A0A2P6P231_ROSCH|nr:hypothetical protein RchiOBHm_Chr7g0179301 [Rosa chinensis]